MKSRIRPLDVLALGGVTLFIGALPRPEFREGSSPKRDDCLQEQLKEYRHGDGDVLD